MRRRNLLYILLSLLVVLVGAMAVLVIYMMRPVAEQPASLAPPSGPPKQVYEVDPYAATQPVKEGGQVVLDAAGRARTWAQVAFEAVQSERVLDPAYLEELAAWEAKVAEAEAITSSRRREKALEELEGEKPRSRQTTIRDLVERGHLQRQLDMAFLELDRTARGTPRWQALHLDKDNAFDPDESQREQQKPDPYYEVFLEYGDEHVSVGPVWVVKVDADPRKTRVVPRNDFARIFHVSEETPQVTEGFQARLSTVVSALINHQYKSGLRLGGYLLQRFMTRPQEARQEGDRVIGWTVDHIFNQEYEAYFQWVENGEPRIARWDLFMTESEEGGAPNVTFTPRGLLAIDIMNDGETFCPGRLDDETGRCELELGLLEACPVGFEVAERCEPEESARCCGVEGEGASRRVVLDVEPLEPEALRALYAVVSMSQYGVAAGACEEGDERHPLGQCEVKVGGVSACPAGFEPGSRCAEGEALCCEARNDHVILTVPRRPGALRVAQASLKVAEALGQAQGGGAAQGDETTSGRGSMWPDGYVADQSRPRLQRWTGRNAATIEAGEGNEGVRLGAWPIFNAFSAVLEQEAFVNAVQDMLSVLPSTQLHASACVEHELALRQVAGADARDTDGDGVKDAEDTCVTLANPPADHYDPVKRQRVVGQPDFDGNGVGNECECRWQPSKEGELAATPDGAFRQIYRTIYPYHTADGVREVGFYIVADYKEDLAEVARRKDDFKALLLSTREVIVPIDTISEWAFWSVNPRNMKGRVDRARAALPKPAPTPAPEQGADGGAAE